MYRYLVFHNFFEHKMTVDLSLIVSLLHDIARARTH